MYTIHTTCDRCLVEIDEPDYDIFKIHHLEITEKICNLLYSPRNTYIKDNFLPQPNPNYEYDFCDVNCYRGFVLDKIQNIINRIELDGYEKVLGE